MRLRGKFYEITWRVTDIKKRDFSKEAVTWDENPARVKLAEDIAAAISKSIPSPETMDALDFGCGTGLLTLLLQPTVRSITGIDSAQGMLDVLGEKISRLKLPNIRTCLADLEKGDTLCGAYHLIVSSMTLHHVPDLRPLFRQFYAVTAQDGYLCLADLDPDDGGFHADNTGVFHFGFNRAEIAEILTEAGFRDIQNMTAAEVTKPAPDGQLKRFSVFLINARK